MLSVSLMWHGIMCDPPTLSPLIAGRWSLGMYFIFRYWPITETILMLCMDSAPHKCFSQQLLYNVLTAWLPLECGLVAPPLWWLYADRCVFLCYSRGKRTLAGFTAGISFSNKGHISPFYLHIMCFVVAWSVIEHYLLLICSNTPVFSNQFFACIPRNSVWSCHSLIYARH